MYRPAATYFATTDIAPVAPGLSGHDFCLALPGRCGVVAIPSSVFYDPADPAAGRTLVRWAFCKRGRRPARRAGPLSIVVTMSIPITWVDAFSDVAFGGNPAAVCLLDEPLDDARMQSLAFELGIAETAYLTPTDDPTTFGLRWFSPATEIDLCGHATLASAHALRAGGTVDGGAPLTFHTRSGPLRAAFDGDRIELDFPADPMTPGPAARPAEGAVARRRRRQRAPPTSSPSSSSPRPRRWRRYVPDLGRHRGDRVQGAAAHRGGRARLGRRLRAAGLRAHRGHRRGPGHRFGPVLGRALLGGAAGPRRPWWPASSPGRGATLYVRPDGDRVRIAGHATTVLTGHLC